jgi:Tol biopolymer transport system component
VRDEYAIPPLRDLSGDRLAMRKRHLVAEIAHRSQPRRVPTRAVVVLAAAFVLVVVGTATAFAVRSLILSISSAIEGSPVWSPDGKRIAYIVSSDGRDDLYVMNADGSAQRQLIGNADSAAWSPDGRKLAFVRHFGVPYRSKIYGGSDVYVADAGGGGLRKLPHTAWSSFVWLPDGRLAIAKAMGCPPCSGNNELWVMNADGSGRRLVASGFPLGRFDWSPDGQSIVFERFDQRDRRDHIYVMAADGSGRRWLADGTRPLWSPRGEVITFLADRTDALWRINADGSGRRKLTGTAGVYAVNGSQGYSWSPDGRKIVFTASRFPVDMRDTEVYVMNADGSGQRNLTRHHGADDLAAWSPDGRKIAFTSDRSGTWEIHVMNADGSGQRNLSRPGGTG